MQIPVVLNEASYRVWPNNAYEGIECITHVSDALRELAKLPRSVFLLTDEKIGDITLGERPLRGYLGESSVRDALRRILLFASKSPLSSFEELDAEGVECLVGEGASMGVLYAHLLGTVALSFPVSDWCRREMIEARLLELATSGELGERNVTTPNVALADHVPIHSTKLLEYREAQVEAGPELWAVLNDWFPGLRFLPRVESDLAEFPKASLALDQIVERLSELDATIREWNGNGQPAWRSKVTPESEGRRSLCDFRGPDGVVRNYELHARYTPGAGRIHFRLLPADSRAEIAYIGCKLSG